MKDKKYKDLIQNKLMSIYSIEGNINFYEELYKSLDDIEENNENSEKKCLITNMPLIENFVTLECNHKFNYSAIFNDIFNHKKKYNMMEGNSLKTTEIRCPYCRNIQSKLLPFIEGTKKIHGVNFFDENIEISNSYKLGQDYIKGDCCYVTKCISISDDSIDPSNNIIEVKCSNKYVKLLPINNKYYCSMHKYSALKEITKENKLKDKEEKIAQKKLLKEEKLKTKMEEKLKTNFINMIQNTIVSHTPIEINNESKEQNQCFQILKSGVKKGQQCCSKLFNDNLCKRHYNIKFKNVEK